MTINVRQTAPTQYLSATNSSQVLTFQATGLVLVTVEGNTCFVATDIVDTVDASTGVPVLAGQALIQTGQQYNQDPGNVYVSILTEAGTADVYVTPVSV